MWRKLAIAVAVVMVVFAANAASARQGDGGWGSHEGGSMHGPHGPGRGMGGMDGGMFGPGLFMRGVPTDGPLAEKLQLTGTQVDRLEEIKDRSKREMITLQADFKIAHLDLEKAIETDAKPSELDAALNRVAAAHAALLKNRVHGIADQRAVLTPAQRKTMEDYKPERSRRGK